MSPKGWKTFFAQNHSFSTYDFGLLQARAYRVMKQFIADALSRYALTPFDWALLGVLYEHPEGISQRHLAQALGVEPPLVTRQLESLSKKKMILRTEDTQDQRVKLVRLSEYGKSLIPKIEERLQHEMHTMVKDISLNDLQVYQRVLKAFVQHQS